MTLVLAFSVQGTADAVDDPNSDQSLSEIVKLRGPNTTFRISVSLPFDLINLSDASTGGSTGRYRG